MIALNEASEIQADHFQESADAAVAESGSAFKPFSESELWDLQHEMLNQGLTAPSDIESPRLAKAYAAMAMAFWRDCLAAGSLDNDQPLMLVALGAGHGGFVWQLLGKLFPWLQHSELAEMGLRCLVCDASVARLEVLENHSDMVGLIEQGLVELVHWDGESSMPPQIWATGKGQVRNLQLNPPLVIANDFFSRLRQEWYQVNFGKIFRIETAVQESAEGQSSKKAETIGDEIRISGPFNGKELVVRKAQEEMEICPENPWHTLLHYYRERLDNTVLTLPVGAISCIEQLKNRFKGRFMVLAADYGDCREKELRANGLPVFSGEGAFSLPVNFHALTAMNKGQGGTVMSSHRHPDNRIFSAVTFGLDAEKLKNTNPAFSGNIINFDGNDLLTLQRHLAAQAEHLQPAVMLSLLLLSGYDPEMLRLFLPNLLDRPIELAPEERFSWIEALEITWQQYWPAPDQSNLCFELGLLAMDLGAWSLAADCFQSAIALFGDHPACLYNLALTLVQIGETDDALAILRHARKLESESEDIDELIKDLEAKLATENHLDWYDQSLCRDGQLCLVPLSEQHAPAFWYQYRDLNIGIMTRLPEFQSMDEVKAWIKEQNARKEHSLCAVLHREHGFVGAVAMSWLKKTGYFYFWIGADFQGRGYGQQAAAMLFRMMRHAKAIEPIYTSVYDDNGRSKQALIQLGFSVLPFKAEKPDQDVVFFRLGHGETENQTVYEELDALLSDTDSPMKLVGVD